MKKPTSGDRRSASVRLANEIAVRSTDAAKAADALRLSHKTRSRCTRHIEFVDAGLVLEDPIEGAPSELGALHACRHMRDVFELGCLIQIFHVFFGKLVAANHAEEKSG